MASKKKFTKKNFLSTLIFFCGILFTNSINAHMRGIFLSEEEAENRSLELGCEGIHKNQDKWMPCKNEKELHIYLRK